MTTEVSVMNKQAIALATDSAGTVTLKEGEKIYFSENKLFTLSKYCPIGIMVYGNSDFMMVPIEILIKEYRKKINCKSFSKLHDYAKDFIRFVGGSLDSLFTKEIQDTHIQYTISAFIKSINEDLEKFESLEEKLTLIDRLHKLFSISDYLENCTKEKEVNFEKELTDVIKVAIKDDISIELPNKSFNKLKMMCVFIFTRIIHYTNNYAGIVFAGYGEEEYFPSIESYRFYGIANGLLKYVCEEEKSDKITHVNDVSVMAFAQGDVVSMFMEGIDPDYRKSMFWNVEELLKENSIKILNKITSLEKTERDTIEKELDNDVKNLMKKFYEDLDNYQYEYYVSPIITNVKFLAKDELAEMAETLVNITSYKRKSTMVPETVGGPIDVAVISKGDGFIWIKRKHYFKPENNHHFFANYYRKQGEENAR
ncbi:MAG: hypothetical protein AB2L18_00990 [Anaerolineaceae bacterium]